MGGTCLIASVRIFFQEIPQNLLGEYTNLIEESRTL